ncbi:MAG: hypothetical protein AAFQ82_17335, partial [Myxococcota bacterium]
MIRVGSILMFLVLGGACSTSPFARVIIDDPNGLAQDATEMAVGFTGQLRAQRFEGDFPVTVLLTSSETGPQEGWFEAGNSGGLLASARREVSFGDDDRDVRVSLTRSCEVAGNCESDNWAPKLLAAGTGTQRFREAKDSWWSIARLPNGRLYATDTQRIFWASEELELMVPVSGDERSGALLEAQEGLSAIDVHVPATRIRASSSNGLWIADADNHRIQRMNPADGSLGNLVGGVSGFADGPATEAEFREPVDATENNDGVVFIADRGNRRVRAYDIGAGVVDTVLGDGSEGCISNFVFDSSLGARLRAPSAVALLERRLFIADSQCRHVLEFRLDDERVRILAGSGDECDDDGAANRACFREPYALALSGNSALVVADLKGNTLREIDLEDGSVTTIAGTGGSGFDGDGPATQRTVSAPSDVSTDGARVLFADSGSGRLRTAEAGRLTSLTGDQPKAEPALRSAFVQPGDCVYDNAGRITVIDGDVLRRFDPARGTLTRIAGNGATDGPLGDDGPATAGRLNSPSGLAFDGEGGLWVADRANHRIRRIDPTTGVITTVAGGNR